MIVRTNSPCQHLRKCLENSMENMQADVNSQDLLDMDWLKRVHATSLLCSFIVTQVLASEYTLFSDEHKFQH